MVEKAKRETDSGMEQSKCVRRATSFLFWLPGGGLRGVTALARERSRSGSSRRVTGAGTIGWPCRGASSARDVGGGGSRTARGRGLSGTGDKRRSGRQPESLLAGPRSTSSIQFNDCGSGGGFGAIGPHMMIDESRSAACVYQRGH